MSIRQIDPADVEALAARVKALNQELARVVGKYGPAVEIRPGHGYTIGEYAYVKVEITHGRLSIGSPCVAPPEIEEG